MSCGRNHRTAGDKETAALPSATCPPWFIVAGLLTPRYPDPSPYLHLSLTDMLGVFNGSAALLALADGPLAIAGADALAVRGMVVLASVASRVPSTLGHSGSNRHPDALAWSLFSLPIASWNSVMPQRIARDTSLHGAAHRGCCNYSQRFRAGDRSWCIPCDAVRNFTPTTSLTRPDDYGRRICRRDHPARKRPSSGIGERGPGCDQRWALVNLQRNQTLSKIRWNTSVQARGAPQQRYSPWFSATYAQPTLRPGLHTRGPQNPDFVTWLDARRRAHVRALRGHPSDVTRLLGPLPFFQERGLPASFEPSDRKRLQSESDGGHIPPPHAPPRGEGVVRKVSSE